VNPVEVVLTLWCYGHIADGEVTRWAWAQVALQDKPSEELLDLATDGPIRCLKRAAADFSPRPIKLTYEQEFSLQAVRTEADSDDSTLRLAIWAAKRAMGEDLSDPLVQLGYQWDHLINDCGDTRAAVSLVRSALPKIMPRCNSISAVFVLDGAFQGSNLK
jgi:hypothetical protein